MTSLGRIIHPVQLFRATRQGPASSVTSNRYFRQEPAQSGRLTDIGTRRIYSEDHDMFRETVRKFFKEEIIPHHDKWEKEGQVSRESWLKAGEMGLLGLSTPIEKGGSGADWLMSTVVHEEQTYANCTGPGYVLHTDIVIPYIVSFGTKGQQEKYLADMIAGRKIGSIAMTEPGAGSDLQGIRTTAKKDGDDWILNGSKVFITNGWMCDMCLVVAVTDTEAKTAARGLSLFIVDADNPGFKKGRKLNKIGFKAQDTAELFFEDCRVPGDALLGGEAGLNRGFLQLMNQLPQERMLIGTVCVSMCEGAFEETRDYVKERKAFGRRIADLQVIQHTLAEIKTEVSVARAFVDQCNELHNVGKLNSSTASMAKYYASDLASTVSHRCLQMFGGWGLSLIHI